MGVLASIINRYISGSFESDVFNIKSHALTSCGFTSVSFPNVVSIGPSAFHSCTHLTSISFPNVLSIGEFAFKGCFSFTSVSFPNATSIDGYAFDDCFDLITIYVGTARSTVCTSGSHIFRNCNSLANIYVPASLVDSYKSATNWSEYADKIKAAP